MEVDVAEGFMTTATTFNKVSTTHSIEIGIETETTPMEN